jgi:hypothetical protein
MINMAQCKGKLLWLDLRVIQNECGKGNDSKRKITVICKENIRKVMNSQGTWWDTETND